MSAPRRTVTLALLLLSAAARGQPDPAAAQVVYPPASRTLTFSHARHALGRGLCLRCHPAAQHSVSPQDRLIPGEQACQLCHAATTRADLTARASAAPGCRTCHTGYTGQGSPARSAFPPANLRFSHRVHMEARRISFGGAEAEARCKTCHDVSGAGRPLPAMATCRACHAAAGVPDRCGVCHLTDKEGRLRTTFPAGRLVPSGALAGDKHDALFRRDHAAAARGKGDYCRSCHARQDCLACHAGSLRPLSIHAGDYVRRHALDARRDKPRCASCHRSQSFCLSCHQNLGVGVEAAASGFAPRTSAAFHPGAFTAPAAGPGHHSYAARRNVGACSSCHREQTCIRCHGGVQRQGGGISPHPAGFRRSARCRALSARNQRVCYKCHTAGDRSLSCF